VRIIRRNSIELVDAGRVLDLLEEGEWFGHPAMLSRLPPSWAAQAGDDTLCYWLAGSRGRRAAAGRAEGAALVARSLMAPPRAGMPAEPTDLTARSDLPARAHCHEELVTCAPDTPIREAAQLMANRRASCAVATARIG
jgi:signal-transduction protein with cAMP-binding, CBS, and nucleotidyltransferase domain